MLVSIHVTVFVAVFLTAYVIRFDGLIPVEQWQAATTFLPVLVALKLAAFLIQGSYRGWCRYNTFDDMIGMARAATYGTLAVVAATAVVDVGEAIPRSILVIDWAGTMMAIGGLRSGIRLFREHYYPCITRRNARPTLIFGASEFGIALSRQVHNQPQLDMRVVGFIDDSVLAGRLRGGIKILGGRRSLEKQIARHGIKVVLAPTPVVSPREIRELVTTCNRLKVRVQVVPGLDTLLSGDFTLHPRDVDIHDLLFREPVRLDGEAVGHFLGGRTVLITGAAGSIGSELCRQVLSFGPERLIVLDHSENGLFFLERELRPLCGPAELVVRVASITDPSRLRAVFDELRPDVVLHAAAHKHVPMMETNAGEAVKNNVFGTRLLVDEAIRAGVESFVMISTDKAVNPTSVMGACKRLAEMYVQACSGLGRTRLMTVRFGNVLGSNGSVVPLFQEQIRQGGPLTVTHPDMTRYFMTIPEATQLVLQAGAQGWGGEIFVLDMGQPVRIVDLARDLIRLSGMAEGRDIEIAFTGLRPGEKLYEELYDADEERLTDVPPKDLLGPAPPVPPRGDQGGPCCAGHCRAGTRPIASSRPFTNSSPNTESSRRRDQKPSVVMSKSPP